MLDATKAPDIGINSGSVLLTATVEDAFPAGTGYGAKGGGFRVLVVKVTGLHTFVVDASGTGRLIRKREGQAFNEKHVYVNSRKYECGPLDLSGRIAPAVLSGVLAVYLKAIGEITHAA